MQSLLSQNLLGNGVQKYAFDLATWNSYGLPSPSYSTSHGLALGDYQAHHTIEDMIFWNDEMIITILRGTTLFVIWKYMEHLLIGFIHA